MSHYGISLPETLPHFKNADRKDVDDQWQQAYKTCLQYEARSKSCFDYMRSRALGYLVREAPYDESRDWVCQEINNCLGENVKLQDLADLYIRSFLQVFRPSSSWSRPLSPSFDTMEDSPEDLESTPLTTGIEQALKRDNYRCIVTGVYTLDLEYAPKTPHPVGCMEVVHILPSSESMNAGVANEDKRNEAAGVWTVMQRFGKISPEELNGDQAHRLENVMTLWHGIHSLFEKLYVWFEPSDDDPYTCSVKTSQPSNKVLGLPETFTMTTTDPNFPRPSPDYLRLHAACARIANLSGAANYVNSRYRDIDDQDILEIDGSPAMMALCDWGQE